MYAKASLWVCEYDQSGSMQTVECYTHMGMSFAYLYTLSYNIICEWRKSEAKVLCFARYSDGKICNFTFLQVCLCMYYTLQTYVGLKTAHIAPY